MSLVGEKIKNALAGSDGQGPTLHVNLNEQLEASTDSESAVQRFARVACAADEDLTDAIFSDFYIGRFGVQSSSFAKLIGACVAAVRGKTHVMRVSPLNINASTVHQNLTPANSEATSRIVRVHS